MQCIQIERLKKSQNDSLNVHPFLRIYFCEEPIGSMIRTKYTLFSRIDCYEYQNITYKTTKFKIFFVNKCMCSALGLKGGVLEWLYS